MTVLKKVWTCHLLTNDTTITTTTTKKERKKVSKKVKRQQCQQKNEMVSIALISMYIEINVTLKFDFSLEVDKIICLRRQLLSNAVNCCCCCWCLMYALNGYCFDIIELCYAWCYAWCMMLCIYVCNIFVFMFMSFGL